MCDIYINEWFGMDTWTVAISFYLHFIVAGGTDESWNIVCETVLQIHAREKKCMCRKINLSESIV